MARTSPRYVLEKSSYDYHEDEIDAILPASVTSRSNKSRRRFSSLQLLLAFIAGLTSCSLLQMTVNGTHYLSYLELVGYRYQDPSSPRVLGVPFAGSTERHRFPPASPTNANPALFPTDVGYHGGTPTGAEPAIVATAPSYPLQTGAAQLVTPGTLGGKQVSEGFDLLKSWSNLSPWYSVDSRSFGLNTSPEVPDTCRVTGLHFLHRHGARYPTDYSSYAGPAKLAARLHKYPGNWNATDDLSFLNEWTYKLGEEVLTPFGRQQLYNLGISLRLKYGFLLKNFTEANTIPVFRTESQDRMMQSALHFSLGFFGYPLEGRYQQSIVIEGKKFNSTLAPYNTCNNSNDRKKSDRGAWYLERWAAIYLEDARTRLQAQLHGYVLSIEDVFTMQQMCAYETVALGYSKFCQLFTEKEWEGFNYGIDLCFWYNSAFGSPVARAQGVGYIQELVARLTHTPIPIHNTSTNSTLNDNPITFPLDQSLYVDATHEVVILNVITALNLTNFAVDGPLPYDSIPKKRSFRVSELAPFASNIQFQLLECASLVGQQIRVIINDGVSPLTGIKGCPKQKDGMCSVETFVKAQKETIGSTDWSWECLGDWEVPPGMDWNTTTGSPPPPDLLKSD